MVIAPLMMAVALAARPHPQAARVRRGYVQGTVLLSHYPPAPIGYHRVSPNLEGRAPAVSLSGGGFVTRSIGLEGEVLYGREVKRPQRFSYFTSEDYVAASRDLLINELLRYRPGGRARFQILAGGGYARTTAAQRSKVVTFGFPPITSNVPDASYSYHSFTLTGGVDGAIPLSARLALVPAFRVRWISRPDATTSESQGIGNYALQFGAGLRVW